MVLLNLAMPEMTGIEVLRALRPHLPDLPVLVLTSNGSVSNAVSAMQAGATDFLIKPIASERLEVSITNALKIRSLTNEVRRLKAPEDSAGFDRLVAQADTTKRAIRIAARGAASSIPMLIEGESGIGKEVFARAIHAASARADGPFVAVNCGALPDTLVESILFGHEKGAFTGAIAKRTGKFEEADGGTLFLDEIGELPLEAQVKLLRVIQEGEVDPVGGARTVSSDFRLITATNRDLAAEVGAGDFAKIFTIASVSFLCPCRRYAIGAPIFCRWPKDSLAALRWLRAKRSLDLQTTQRPTFKLRHGLVTSDSLKT